MIRSRRDDDRVDPSSTTARAPADGILTTIRSAVLSLGAPPGVRRPSRVSGAAEANSRARSRPSAACGSDACPQSVQVAEQARPLALVERPPDGGSLGPDQVSITPCQPRPAASSRAIRPRTLRWTGSLPPPGGFPTPCPRSFRGARVAARAQPVPGERGDPAAKPPLVEACDHVGRAEPGSQRYPARRGRSRGCAARHRDRRFTRRSAQRTEGAGQRRGRVRHREHGRSPRRSWAFAAPAARQSLRG